MNTEMIETNELKRISKWSGLLFQPHPSIEGWKVTRASGRELVAFKSEKYGVKRLSVKLGRNRECFEVDLMTKERWITDYFETKNQAFERVKEVMEREA